MNTKDNEAKQKAIDSLLNFETVRKLSPANYFLRVFSMDFFLPGFIGIRVLLLSFVLFQEYALEVFIGNDTAVSVKPATQRLFGEQISALF